MKIACIGDIHSNYKALEACLTYMDANHYDGILFLGDYVSDCPYPEKTMDLLKEAEARYQTWFIKGNREAYLLDYHQEPHDYWQNTSHSGSLLYTYENLRPSDLEWFNTLPISRAVHFDQAPDIVICHGSPGTLRENLFPDSALSDYWLDTVKTDYLICAHTHKPFEYRKGNKFLINCGSLGLPVNGQTKAQFTTLDLYKGDWRRTLISINYDIKAILEAFKTSGLHERASVWSMAVAKLLISGRNYPLDCLHLAEKMALKDNPKADLRTIPERYWHQAAHFLGVI